MSSRVPGSPARPGTPLNSAPAIGLIVEFATKAAEARLWLANRVTMMRRLTPGEKPVSIYCSFVYFGRYLRAEFTCCENAEGESVKKLTAKQVYPLHAEIPRTLSPIVATNYIRECFPMITVPATFHIRAC